MHAIIKLRVGPCAVKAATFGFTMLVPNKNCLSQILYPFHSHYNLTLLESNEKFVCDECLTLSSGFKYGCKDCSFNLDLTCASSTNAQTSKEVESKRPEDIINRRIKHFSHTHTFTLFSYREVDFYTYLCGWCGMPPSGMCYGCVSCMYILHNSCLSRIPNKILSHPFHPSHPLDMHHNTTNVISYCHACCSPTISFIENMYCCRSGCNYTFHIGCINLKPTLKHERHQHSLIYFLVKLRAEIPCNKCGLRHKTEQGQAFYGCVQCEFKILLECLIPSSVKHKYHRHSLTLCRDIEQDKSEEYYCDICEEIWNPYHHVYYCKECLYAAHIECALDMFDRSSGCYILKHEEAQQSDAKFQSNGQIDYFDHEHPLSFNERIGKNNYVCNACNLKICEEAGYVCESCHKYFIHKACVELPQELLHPLHSYHPPLSLLNIQESGTPTLSVCDNCRHIICGLVYTCFECGFTLDVKCAITFSVTNGLKNLIERRQDKLLHFSHHHELLFGYFNSPYLKEKKLYCAACNSSTISGPAYFCEECRFCVHESCLFKLPRNIQIPCHAHTLYPSFQEGPDNGIDCRLCCDSNVNLLIYGCNNHDKFEIHYRCAGSLMHPLKSKHHSHDLYFLHNSIAYSKVPTTCGRCEGFIGKDESVYCCIECSRGFHINCAGVPSKIESKYHVHLLIFKDRFIEDDSGDYYCDICEEERDPNLAVYSCEECQRPFVAHTECILDKEIIEVVSPEQQRTSWEQQAEILKRQIKRLNDQKKRLNIKTRHPHYVCIKEVSLPRGFKEVSLPRGFSQELPGTLPRGFLQEYQLEILLQKEIDTLTERQWTSRKQEAEKLYWYLKRLEDQQETVKHRIDILKEFDTLFTLMDTELFPTTHGSCSPLNPPKSSPPPDLLQEYLSIQQKLQNANKLKQEMQKEIDTTTKLYNTLAGSNPQLLHASSSHNDHGPA